MAAGAAREHFKRTRRRVRFWHKGHPRWHDIWDGLPWLVHEAVAEDIDDWQTRPNGLRPYIAGKLPNCWRWREYQPTPAGFVIKQDEIPLAVAGKGAVLIEPCIKSGASPNKQWSPRRWQQLVEMSPDVPWVQVGTDSAQALRGVEYIRTKTFREAMAVLSGCAAAVLPEGGLHHAAAAVNVPAVVIFGGYISPKVTGYKSHINLFTGEGLGCGMRVACPHCSSAMAAISPEWVLSELQGILNEKHRRGLAA